MEADEAPETGDGGDRSGVSNREVLTFASCQPVQVTDKDPGRPWQRSRPAKSDSAGPWAALGGEAR